MNRYVTMGLTVLVGAALFEAALIPGMAIGAAAVLAPGYLPKLRRRLQPLFDVAAPQPAGATAPMQSVPDSEATPLVPRELGIKRAVAKTITFRIIVTTLDFSANYLVIGELASAAGLSTFALVAGPLFYFAHETAWNYLGPAGTEGDIAVVPLLRGQARTPLAGAGELALSRPLAKTITYRAVATVTDFTANYVVVGEVATAALLTAFAFVIGPFVYLGHEKAWDYYDPPPERRIKSPMPPNLLPAPG
jgi:uncharacterized membrane protein